MKFKDLPIGSAFHLDKTNKDNIILVKTGYLSNGYAYGNAVFDKDRNLIARVDEEDEVYLPESKSPIQAKD